MTYIALGGHLPKKPKPKKKKFTDDTYGFVDAENDFIGGVEIFGYSDTTETFELCETCTKTDEFGAIIQVVNGIIQ